MAIKSYALTTVQRLADFIGLGTPVSGTATYNVLERIIDTLTEWIENYIGRRIKQTAYSQEYYDGDGSQILVLKQYPVSSSASFTLEVRTSEMNEDSWDTEDSDQYYVDYATGIVRFIPGRVFMRGTRKYRVSYTAGYDFDNSADFLSDTEAGDLEYAFWKIAGTAWDRRKGGTGIEQESIGDYSVKYAKTVFESEEIKEILDKYKKFEASTYVTPSQT